MIEKQTIDGREASVAYLTQDFEPAGKEDWYLAKVIFDDGEVVFVRNVEADEEAAGD
jgi:hypothetical protein